MSLAAAPDGYVAVRAPVHRGGVRLYVALVHRLGAELALHDDIGVLEALLGVAHLKKEVVCYVRAVRRVPVISEAASPHVRVGDGGQALMKDRRLGLHRLHHIRYRAKHFVLDLNEVQRLLGDMGAGCGHRGHCVTLVQHLLACQAVVAEGIWG